MAKLNWSDLENDFNTLSVKDLQSKLMNAGMKKSKLEDAVGTSFLPKTGVFSHFEIEGSVTYKDGSEVDMDNIDDSKIKDDFRHIKLYTECGASISLSKLQLSAFNDSYDGDVTQPKMEIVKTDPKSDENSSFGIIANGNNKGGLYLKSPFKANAMIQGNQAVALKRLIGKSFNAEKVTLQRAKFSTTKITDFKKVELQAVDTYILSDIDYTFEQ